MKQRKQDRDHKRKFGQFLTPLCLAKKIVSCVNFKENYRILEPSCGDGAFLTAILEQLKQIPTPGLEITGIELDTALAKKSRLIAKNNNNDLAKIKIIQNDFFKEYLIILHECLNQHISQKQFDLIIGNPPFGGSFNSDIEDKLDIKLGKRFGKKIKKETYSFFIVACIDLLKLGGKIIFICSDTLLTISTMAGLRYALMEQGDVVIKKLTGFSDETEYPMVVLEFIKLGCPGSVTYNDNLIDKKAIQSTKNMSWGIKPEFTKAFSGPTLGDFFIASSGMTTGKNELFLRKVNDQKMIEEPYKFEFYDAHITLDYELKKARMGKLSTKRIQQIREAERNQTTERRVSITKRNEPLRISVPDLDYRPYNKSNNSIIYSDPTHYIYWKNNGEAVLTYKKTGNWYLRGVGGQPYFGTEGITWSLVSSRFNIRYLPPGYILDAGAPCAFLRNSVNRIEMYFIIGWLLSDLANTILKTVVNHTRNIQGKDFERMPYPFWLSNKSKSTVINLIKSMVYEGMLGKIWNRNDKEIIQINNIFTSTYDKFNLP